MMVQQTARVRVLASVTRDQWEEQLMETSVLRTEAQVHARYNIPRAQRLRDATLREGLFREYHDATAILGSLVRLERRHQRRRKR